ncbi:MAG: glycosyltransferase [Verrucomicrobiota bacterium]
MRVHHIIASLNIDTGGPAFTVTRINQALNAAGVQSDIHSIDYDRFGPIADPAADPFPRAGWMTRSFRGWSPEFRRQLNHSLLQNPGIVHNHGCWMAPNRDARIFAQKHQLPLIISPRGMLESWSLQFHFLKKKLAWLAYEQKNLQAASAFHATSKSEAEALRKLGLRQPVYLIPNGVDPPTEPVTVTPPEMIPEAAHSRFILFLSRLHPKKGLNLLLKSWETLHTLYPETHLIIAGPDRDDYRGTLTQQMPQISNHPQVHWIGPVRGESKSWLLTHARFLILPTYSENFGQVIAESLAHRTPVLTTDRTPWKELAQRGCGWVISPDQQQLSEAMSQALATADAVLQQMGSQGHQWMEQEFSWSQIGRSMHAAYRHILGTGPAPDFVITT